ncbi:MAG TPA: quinoprotein relay system zinc metallohydrolase 2 [Casimicrobiaceae bacterium]|nr:quinoprotein relay system zinc metallohydrolase 2 [Casimicrobiaceae bacterium]
MTRIARRTIGPAAAVTRIARRTIGLPALAVALACLSPASAHAQATALAVENPAPGIYVHYGQQAVASRANAGDIANAGFIVGARCVAVVDTGGSYSVGRALREAIRAVTAKPVCYVINTHMHPDHVFGNAAFAGDGAEFVGHARAPDALRRRGPNYLAALKRDLGDAANGTQLVPPTRTIEGSASLDLGSRVLTLRSWPTAHTDADLTVFDETTRTLWLGDLAFTGHIPVVDGNLRGFLAAIAELRTMPADRAIPGHGRAAAWPGALDAQEAYLRRLQADVRGAIKSGRTLAQAVATVGGDRRAWLLYDEFHKRNVSAAYAELEWE